MMQHIFPLINFLLLLLVIVWKVRTYFTLAEIRQDVHRVRTANELLSKTLADCQEMTKKHRAATGDDPCCE